MPTKASATKMTPESTAEPSPPQSEEHKPWQGEGEADQAEALIAEFDEETEADVSQDEALDAYPNISDATNRMVVYRDALAKRLHDSLQLVTVRAAWDLIDRAAGILEDGVDGELRFDDKAAQLWLDDLESTPEEPRMGGVFGDELGDVRIVVHKDLELAVKLTPFPPTTHHHATVRTPATVEVDGVCHDCGEISTLAVALDTKYISDSQKHEMQLTSKATHGSHRHGQMLMAATQDPGPSGGQQSMEGVNEGQAETDDETPDPEEEEEDLAAEVEAEDEPTAIDGDDLLPEPGGSRATH